MTPAKTVLTYTKSTRDPGMNIRVAVGDSPDRPDLQAKAIARYYRVPVASIWFDGPELKFYIDEWPEDVARVEHVEMDLEAQG